MVRAKFHVTRKEDSEDGGGNVSLEPVYDGSEENKRFFKWTPSGLLEMGIVNETAFEQFEVGREFYVDFTSAEK